MAIQVKRVYEPPSTDDGKRFLVDRLWPRGIRKDDLHIEAWLKDVAPSDALRKWYGHEPAKWPEFQKRYAAELGNNLGALQPLLDAARKGDVALLFSSKELERNNALALKRFLERQLRLATA